MPFEARKTNLTVFSLNHEMYNLIKSAFNLKLETTSTRTYRCQKPRRSADQVSLSKTYIVLNGLNKSILHWELIKLPTKWAIIMSWWTLNMLSFLVNYRPEAKQIKFFRASESQTVPIVPECLNLIKQGNSTHDQRLPQMFFTVLVVWTSFARK